MLCVLLAAACTARSPDPGGMIDLGTESSSGATSTSGEIDTSIGDPGDSSLSFIVGTSCVGECGEAWTDTETGTSSTSGGTSSTSSSTSGTGESTASTGDEPVCGDDTRLVFVTSAPFTGQIGGLVSADEACRGIAAGAGLPRASSYRAWLSDAESGPAQRFDANFTGCYKTTSGAVVAHDGFVGLTTAPLHHGIAFDEHGSFALEGENTGVWSSTGPDGQPLGGATCDGWTTMSPGANGGFGDAIFSKGDGAIWTTVGETTCQASLRLYCFEDLE